MISSPTDSKQSAAVPYSNVLSHVSDPVAVVRNGELCYANRPFVDLTGVEGGSGVAVSECAPRDTAPDLERFCAAVQDSDPAETSTRLVCQTGAGERITVSVDAMTVEHDGNRATALVFDESTVHADKPPAHRYERVVEALPVGVFQIRADPDAAFSLVNDRMVDLFGADTKHDLIDLPVADLFADEEDYAEFAEELGSVGAVYGAEVELETLDGDDIWGSVTAVVDDVGDTTEYDGAVQDITRRKEAERDFRNRAQRFRRMFERHSAPMLLVDPDSGGIQNANDAAAQFYGYTTQELTGMRVEDLNQESEAELARVRAQARNEDRNEFQFRHETADGDVRTVEVHSSPIAFEDDELLFSVVHDITERADYESSLETQRDNLDVLNQVLRHDIRNDLQLVFAYAEMLVEEVDGEQGEYAQRILESADHAVELTETARDIADVMLASDQSLSPVPLQSAIGPELNEVRASYPGAAVTVDGSVPDVEVAGNDMLNSVFRNLLKNAIQHNDKPVAEVTVSATEHEDGVTVRVADNGPGVRDSQKQDIFGKGEKGLESAGTGIGLYLVQTLVDGIGGSVWVEDNDPEGAVFVVELQRA